MRSALQFPARRHDWANLERKGGSVMLRLTNHGERRLRQRGGVSKRATLRTAQRALDYGLKPAEATGKLQRYLIRLCRTGKADNVRFYQGCVYLFFGESLLTVFPLPRALRRALTQRGVSLT